MRSVPRAPPLTLRFLGVSCSKTSETTLLIREVAPESVAERVFEQSEGNPLLALELSRENPATEDMASKFFEHFIAIADAMNTHGGMGLWDEEDGFYYDQLHVDGRTIPLKVRSLVGLMPLLAVEIIEDEAIAKLPGFRKRMDWFLEHRKDLADNIAYMESAAGEDVHGHRLLAIPSRDRRA